MADMQEYTGKLRMLGNGTWSPNGKILAYSMIEIGDHLLTQVGVGNTLDNFVGRALKQEGDTTLYVKGGSVFGRAFGLGARIVGVRLPDGNLYYQKLSAVPAWLFIVLGILTIPACGLGLLVLPMGVLLLGHVNAAASLASLPGAKPVAFNQAFGN
jgi:hypothetical protein